MLATSGRLGYRRALDGLRGVAIASVMAHHAAAYLVPSWFTTVVPGGFLGVDLFFVLSGYLITTLIVERHERDGERTLGRFYVRRALRLVPAVVALLVVHAVFIALARPGELGDSVRSTVAVLSYSANYAVLLLDVTSRYLGHTWSLAIEEQFYLVFPLLLLGGLRRSTSRSGLLVPLAAAICATAVWRAALFSDARGWFEVYARTDARLDALLIGAALALLTPSRVFGRLREDVVATMASAAAVALIGAALLAHRDDAVLYLGGFTAVALLAAVVIAAVVDGRWWVVPLLERDWLVGLGRLSYSLYLWHYPVFRLVDDYAASWGPVGRCLLGVSGAFGAAALSYVVVEKPFLRLKATIERAALPASPTPVH